MKFNAALIAAVAAAATAHGAAVEADDFSDLDAFVGNIPTDALQAAQSSIAAGVQPTPDATEATTPAETSQVAAIVNADDGLPSEEDIDKLIASADAQFGNPGDNKGLPAPPAAATAAPEANANAAQATPRDADQPAPRSSRRSTASWPLPRPPRRLALLRAMAPSRPPAARPRPRAWWWITAATELLLPPTRSGRRPLRLARPSAALLSLA
ncbi:hypothetical protein CRV24_009260 [Beauveria bassiana]|nr:hypothetical protein CRV24_009260 [Beauveria bassiana]